MSHTELLALRALARVQSIVFLKPDKGNDALLLDRSAYVNKLLEVLNDRSKFRLLSDDVFKLTLKRKEELCSFLSRLHRSGETSDDDYELLVPCGSTLCVMYGLPKIHKQNVLLRPILSAIATYMYQIAKFLVPMLARATANECSVRETFSAFLL